MGVKNSTLAANVTSGLKSVPGILDVSSGSISASVTSEPQVEPGQAKRGSDAGPGDLGVSRKSSKGSVSKPSPGVSRKSSKISEQLPALDHDLMNSIKGLERRVAGLTKTSPSDCDLATWVRATIVIQAFGRGILAKNRVRGIRDKKNGELQGQREQQRTAAATRIQALFRGWRKRLYVRSILSRKARQHGLLTEGQKATNNWTVDQV